MASNFSGLDTYTDRFKRYITIKEFKGVNFYDISPLLLEYEAISKAMMTLSNLVRKYKPTVIAACESRGFILAGYMSRELGIGSIMVRKAGKMPGEVVSKTYKTEYSEATIEIQKYVLDPDDRVLVLDDVLATGGTAQATRELIEQLGAKVAGCAFLIELVGMNTQLQFPYESLVRYDNNSKPEPEYPKITSEGYKFHDDPLTKGRSWIGSSVSDYECENPPITVLHHPSMEYLAKELTDMHPRIFQIKSISWGKFPDGSWNITFPDDLRNNDVVYIGSMHPIDHILEQFMLNTVLPRQAVASLKLIYPFFPGTMERVPKRGVLASAETILSNLSKPMPYTKSGPASLSIYDIHALPEQFYTSDNLRIELLSAVPELLKRLPKDFVIVFPDDGAAKRFSETFPQIHEYGLITCNKVRNGEQREVVVKDKHLKPGANKRCIIVDDLVQTGGTLFECAKLMRQHGFVIVDAFVTHAIFPHQSFLEFLPGRSKACIDCFYVTNSIPEVANDLPGNTFQVISLVPSLVTHIAEDMMFNKLDRARNGYKHDIFLATDSEVKLRAVTKFVEIIGCDANIRTPKKCHVKIESEVKEQPMGYKEIETGCVNRILNFRKKVTATEVVISIENGIVEEDGDCYDVACVMIAIMNHVFRGYTRKVRFPKLYFQMSTEKYSTKTVGQIIEEEQPKIEEGTWPKSVNIYGDKITRDDWQSLYCGRTREELILEGLLHLWSC